MPDIVWVRNMRIAKLPPAANARSPADPDATLPGLTSS